MSFNYFDLIISKIEMIQFSYLETKKVINSGLIKFNFYIFHNNLYVKRLNYNYAEE